MKNNRYFLIDIFKLIFACFVVAIHSKILAQNQSAIGYFIYKDFFRVGVPFFFVCSGLFIGLKIYSKREETNTIVFKFIKRLLYPLIFWLIMSLPFELKNLEGKNIATIIDILVRKIIFYPWGAMWYVWALIIGLLLLLPFIKKDKMRIAIALGTILYSFALICNSYYYVVENTVLKAIVDKYISIAFSARNGVFVGFVFIACGILIAKKVYYNSVNHKIVSLLAVGSYILLVAETFLIRGKDYIDGGPLYINLLTFVPLFVLYLTKYKSTRDFSIFATYSAGIYFSHKFFVNLYKYINPEIHSIQLFSLVMVSSLILLTILYKINNKYVNKVIK